MTAPDLQLRTPNEAEASLPGGFPSASPPPESPVIVSSQVSLSQAVRARRSEYTRSHQLKLKVGTWNVAALNGTEKDIGSWFVDGKGLSERLGGIRLEDKEAGNDQTRGSLESFESQEARRSKSKPTVPANDSAPLPAGSEIGIYVLGLQEIVDISSAAEALKPYTDPNPTRKWKQAVIDALPRGYQKVAEHQLIGLYLLIFAADSIAHTISHVSTASVGTGLMGYMGNKGAVAARLVLGESTKMTFINCHLSAGAEKGSLERRNWDALQIQNRTKFEGFHPGEEGDVSDRDGIGNEDFAFWFGDLNYRLEDMPPEDVRRLLMLHTKHGYNTGSDSRHKIENEMAEDTKPPSDSQPLPHEDHPGSNSPTLSAATSLTDDTANSPPTPPDPDQHPSSDPASLETTLSSLLVHDQLQKQIKFRKAFHEGWREGQIDFLPTYKYDVGSVGVFDSSEKRRGPSWCDRILYRTRADYLHYEKIVLEELQARKKDEELRVRGVADAAKDEAVLFDYDPETDGADYDEAATGIEDPVLQSADLEHDDKLSLEHYVSHQRVLSSDHKPLDATFTLEYDAIDPDLRAKIHQEVARELDKAENDGRPSVTVVVDHQNQNGLHSEAIDFGEVQFHQTYNLMATIANIGRVAATVGFAERSPEVESKGVIAPDWLSIRFDKLDVDSADERKKAGPPEYVIQPGEALNFELSLRIEDLDLLQRLNSGTASLEDVLVLRVQNGRDYFLPVKATWLPSVFGRSIEELVRLPEGGVRTHRDRVESKDGQVETDSVKRSAPRELFQLTESIESLIERAIGEWEMTGQDRSKLSGELVGWPFVGIDEEVNTIQILEQKLINALDNSVPVSEVLPSSEATSIQKLSAVSQNLLLFLRSMSGGVINPSLWTTLEQALNDREKSKSKASDSEERTMILETLSSSPPHSVSFTFVTFALSRMANEIAPLHSTAPTSPSLAFQDAFQQQLRSQGEAGKRRHQVEAAFAGTFADAMIRVPSKAASATGKAKKALDVRKRRVVEVFLSGYS